MITDDRSKYEDKTRYTVSSQKAFDAATSDMTPKTAAEWIASGGWFRTLPEKLLRFYHEEPKTPEAMKKFLLQALAVNHPSPNEQESLRHIVSNWFTTPKGLDTRTISREYAIEVCFILRLSLEEANDFLGAVNGEILHCRNVREFVAACALHSGMTYADYLSLAAEAEADTTEAEQKDMEIHKYTQNVSLAAETLDQPEEVLAYIRTHRANFGLYHNTAYEYFNSMLDAMTQVNVVVSRESEDKNVSVKDILSENLYRTFIYGEQEKNKEAVRKAVKASAIKKSILTGWPDPSSFSKMKKREIEVSRKALILLYLACGGELLVPDEEDTPLAYDEDEALLDDIDFEGMHMQVDAMLVDCGFAPLDPRLPFDWMILFCMSTGDLFDVDERFQELLTTMFGNDEQS